MQYGAVFEEGQSWKNSGKLTTAAAFPEMGKQVELHVRESMLRSKVTSETN